MRLEAAITGSLEEAMEAEIKRGESSVTRARDRAALEMQEEIRGVIAQSMGARTAKSWRVRNYPRVGDSMSAASYQYDDTNGGWVIRAVTESGPIKARNGGWIALPTKAALEVLPKKFHHSRDNRGRGGSKIGVAVKTIEQKFGDLQFVAPRGHKRAYLVAEVRRTTRKQKSGTIKKGYAKARRLKSGLLGKNSQSVVMFILVPQVRRAAQSSLSLEQVSVKYNRRYSALIAEEWDASAP